MYFLYLNVILNLCDLESKSSLHMHLSQGLQERLQWCSWGWYISVLWHSLQDSKQIILYT